MNRRYRIFKAVLILNSLLLLNSCKTYNEVSYFQNIDEIVQQAASVETPVDQLTIKPDDLLGIMVSGLDANAVAPFNLPAMSFLTPGEKEISAVQNYQTYLVNADGYINYPVLGMIKVGGMTKNECVKFLQAEISKYVKDPIVNVQFLNFRVSVLGEVNAPGTFTIPNDRVSILEILGQAGDLTIYGERRNVLLIRDNNGKKEFHRIDLNQSDLFTSPYYYLQQDDVVYVEPNLSKKKNSSYSQRDAYNISVISAVISTASVIASLLIALLVK